MRLTPIENPTTLSVRLAYFFCKRQIGRVITPMKTIYARQPALLPLVNQVIKFHSRDLAISEDLKLLVKVYCAKRNHCTFCQDIVLAQLLQHQLGREKFGALGDWRAAEGVFSDAEKAILGFIDEYADSRTTGDETYDQLKRYFSETQIIDIVAIHATEQYFNAMNVPFQIGSDGFTEASFENASPLASAV